MRLDVLLFIFNVAGHFMYSLSYCCELFLLNKILFIYKGQKQTSLYPISAEEMSSALA